MITTGCWKVERIGRFNCETLQHRARSTKRLSHQLLNWITWDEYRDISAICFALPKPVSGYCTYDFNPSCKTNSNGRAAHAAYLATYTLQNVIVKYTYNRAHTNTGENVYTEKETEIVACCPLNVCVWRAWSSVHFAHLSDGNVWVSCITHASSS